MFPHFSTLLHFEVFPGCSETKPKVLVDLATLLQNLFFLSFLLICTSLVLGALVLFLVYSFFFFFFCLSFFYCLTYTTYNTILTLPTLLTLIKTLTPITILTLRYITVLNTTLAKTYLQNIKISHFFFRKQSFALLILLCLHHLNFLSFFFKHTCTAHTNTYKPVKYTRLPLQALH